MKKLSLLSYLFALVIVTVIHLGYFSQLAKAHGAEKTKEGFEKVTSIEIRNLSITVVFDNNPYTEGLTASWGFGCVIRGIQKTILFDTGGSSVVLLNNMKLLGINAKDIDVVVLSHIHGDHVGGLNGFLRANKNVAVYLPETFPEKFKETLSDSGIRIAAVSGPTSICKGVYSTGILGSWIKEQSLIISTDRGLIVITGCAHPGIVNILRTTKDLIEDNIFFVMGGFHLGGASERQLKDIVNNFRKLEVKHVGPCHCSGDLARQFFESEYQKDYIHIGVGRLIKFE